MGSSPSYYGFISISPPLQPGAVSALNDALRAEYPDNLSRSLDEVNDHPMRALSAFTVPTPPSPPSKYCDWHVAAAGSRIEWGGEEKFHHAEHWLAWIIGWLPAGHHCSGRIVVIGDSVDWFDAWRIDVDGRSVICTRYDVPWFSDGRWMALEASDPFIPELIQQALLEAQWQVSDGVDHLRVFFAGLTGGESALRTAVVEVLRDILEVGGAPASWGEVLAGSDGGERRHLRGL
jgi:hypothetical protein